jgi:alginate O-acetyltransferase complex protein AlgI
MSVGSPLFFIASLIAIAICVRRDTQFGKTALLIFNSLFVAVFFNSAVTILPLAVFCFAGFCAVRIAAHRRGFAVFSALIAALLVLFIVIKKYAIVEQFSPLGIDYPTIGLSYILFRILHLIIDCREGSIEKPPTGREYYTYILFFLTFVSGPINRFDSFREDLEAKPAARPQRRWSAL